MKVREIRVKDIRNFKALRAIKFFDEATNLVRPLTVLVGTNGSGKSTLLDVIEGLLSHAIDTVESRPITNEIRESGYAAIHVEFEPGAPPELHPGIWVALGRKDRAPANFRSLPNQIAIFEHRGGPGKPAIQKGPREPLNRWVNAMMREDAPMQAGVIHFPHDRWIDQLTRGPIEPPPRSTQWVVFVDAKLQWVGSLAQLWVWQNYLDLEQQAHDRPNLVRFVSVIENILGESQRVIIKEGRVLIKRPKHKDSVELFQLPSGQQQLVAIFGEIARFLRPGAVILIDEVEISLHPALQRAVIFHLRELAVRHDLQIILTTHSMEIVDAVAPSEVINLDDMVIQERMTIAPSAQHDQV